MTHRMVFRLRNEKYAQWLDKVFSEQHLAKEKTTEGDFAYCGNNSSSFHVVALEISENVDLLKNCDKWEWQEVKNGVVCSRSDGLAHYRRVYGF